MHSDSKPYSNPAAFSMAIKEAGISNQMVGSKCEGLNASYFENVCVVLC